MYSEWQDDGITRAFTAGKELFKRFRQDSSFFWRFRDSRVRRRDVRRFLFLAGNGPQRCQYLTNQLGTYLLREKKKKRNIAIEHIAIKNANSNAVVYVMM